MTQLSDKNLYLRLLKLREIAAQKGDRVAVLLINQRLARLWSGLSA